MKNSLPVSDRAAHYERLLSQRAALPTSAFIITAWNGTRENVRTTVLSTTAHLAECPNRHSQRRDLVEAGLPLCGWRGE